MDVEPTDFGDLLRMHTDRAAIKAERLMSLIRQRFPAIPEWKNQEGKKRCVRVIENWLYRSIKEPRAGQWSLLVAIAAVLSLKVDEIEQLLRVAGMKPLGDLVQAASETYQELFEIWMEPVFAEEVREDLTEVKQELGEQGGLIKEIHTHVLSVKNKPLEEEKPIWMVPFARNPYFTGRDDLLALLDQELLPTGNTDGIITNRVALTQSKAIKGLGGIGKTQIAVECAYRFRDLGRYMHTFWVNAASEETISASFVAIADLLPSLAVTREADQHELVEVVKRWLEQSKYPWLLIFDNADDVALVRDYLPRQGMGSILLTTRAHAVGSLATSVEVETLGFLEGTQLLLRRAQRFEHASDEEINQAGDIVVALDHFPLALDQAGAYLEETQCSFRDYLNLYQTRRQALLGQRGTQATNYPHSVATTWSLSFQKVEQANPAAAELLLLCAFLAPDNIPEELIKDGASQWNSPLQQVATDPIAFNQMIAELLKFSLVKRLVNKQMLSIHRLVQAVQMDLMEPEAQRQWAERVVRAVNKGFPLKPSDIMTWPQCLRYLDQVQACNTLIRQFSLQFVEVADLLNRAGIYLSDGPALYNIAEPLLQSALEIKEQQLGQEHSSVAIILDNLATLYQAQGKYTEAESLYQRAFAIFAQQLGPQHPDTLISLNNLGLLYEKWGRYSEAETLLKSALGMREQRFGHQHLDVANSLANLASLYHSQGKDSEAEPLLRQSLEITEQQLGSQHPDTAISLNNLGMFLRVQRRYSEAEPLLKRALEINEQQLGPQHPQTATSLDNLAMLYFHQEKYEEAELLYRRALEIREQQLGNLHPETAIVLNNLALLYNAQKKYKETELLYRRSLEISEQQLGPQHPQTATSLNNLGLLYEVQGKRAEAKSLHRRIFEIDEGRLGPRHPSTVIDLNGLANLYGEQRKDAEIVPLLEHILAIDLNADRAEQAEVATDLNALADLYSEQGKYAEAESVLKRILAIDLKTDRAEQTEVATDLNALADLYSKQGKYAEAEPLLKFSWIIREQQLGPTAPDTTNSLNNLANLYYRQGRYSEAEPLYMRVLTICKYILGPEHPMTHKVGKNYTLCLQKMGRDVKGDL